ncbi:MAG TPA: SDR family oxidoreductase [Dehalococcoidia bacterium]|nr:SDR family oxidoreductase [Dehalococcoidia bacterium]
MSSLSGKTAIVTGASSGIGRAIAEKLGGAGAHVYLAGRTLDAMEASKARIEAAGGKATPVVIEMRDPAQVQALVQRAASETGRLDVMVNNAGVSHPAPITEGNPEQWREMFETNVIALLTGCNAAVKAMRESKAEGHIVNISSIAALRNDSGVYGSTKHAVNCISNTLRGELEGDTIRVVTIMPGAIATNFARNFEPAVVAGLVRGAGVDVEVKKGERLPDEVFEKIGPAMKQMLGSPDDIADAVLYAVSQPIHVNVAEVVVRPPRQLAI